VLAYRESKKGHQMNLGAFSISLTVKDLNKSIAFYEDLDFTHFGGAVEHGYAV
jgi:hypothetical protein